MSDNATLSTDPLTPEDTRASALTRWVVRGVVTLLLLGAGYLIAMRHEAILADLATMTAWCF